MYEDNGLTQEARVTKSARKQFSNVRLTVSLLCHRTSGWLSAPSSLKRHWCPSRLPLSTNLSQIPCKSSSMRTVPSSSTRTCNIQARNQTRQGGTKSNLARSTYPGLRRQSPMDLSIQCFRTKPACGILHTLPLSLSTLRNRS